MDRKPTALVVDDRDGLRKLVSDLLKLRGYSVRIAADGPEAVEAFLEQPCDLVVTDIDMPRMNGMELLRRLRSLDPRVGVIVMTGGWADKDETATRELGAAFIQKPFTVEAFWSLVTELEADRASQE